MNINDVLNEEAAARAREYAAASQQQQTSPDRPETAVTETVHVTLHITHRRADAVWSAMSLAEKADLLKHSLTERWNRL